MNKKKKYLIILTEHQQLTKYKKQKQVQSVRKFLSYIHWQSTKTIQKLTLFQYRAQKTV